MWVCFVSRGRFVLFIFGSPFLIGLTGWFVGLNRRSVQVFPRPLVNNLVRLVRGYMCIA